ncbi:MAG TPA: prolyl oligopeptidase family serine peptidase [Candidatus Sulfotelmatobacter sp.]|nr:prolyl oligopeptidase family serine peptidase [Candidatus Sulfotelmatobacter sp.]
MKVIRYGTVVLWLCASTLFCASICHTQSPVGAPTKPPVAPVRPVTDDYYGTKIIDNYRYMENLKDPEVQEWFKNQNEYTRATLPSIPGREKLLARIRELDSSASARVTDVQRLPGDRYFYQRLLSGESVPKLHIRQGLGGEERLLMDPGKVEVSSSTASRGRNAFAYVDISQDGKYVAVGITPGGSENDTEIHVFDVATGHEANDVIFRAVHGDPQWLPDNRSFVYGRLQDLPPDAPKTELRQKYRAYLHVLGRNAKEDPTVFGYGVVPAIDVDPKDWASVSASPGSKYVIGGINNGNSPNSRFYIEPVDAVGTSNSAWRKLADLSDGVKDVAVHGDDLYLLTFKNASRYKILRTDARHPDLSSAELVVPPTDAIVETMSAAQDALYVQVLDGGIERILRVPYGPGPKAENVVLPLEGTAIPQGSDPRVPGILLRLESWTDAGNLYSYDPRTRQTTNTQLDQFGSYSRDDNIEAVNVKVRSYDGTLVPLSIRYPKGIKLDGSHPTLLVGYGAYGTVTVHPAFVPDEVAWLERGGILADCGARGGGEYGEDWHLAGKGPTKPNTWRDFIACAEYLVDKKYTSPAHLAGDGRSAGGILIGRAITERPDLFGAAIIVSGVLDALRSETTAHGLGDIQEFGSTKTEDGFKALYAMSAFHHVKDRTAYPAVLITAGINDPRVDPWESAKMTARLQAATSSGKPVLLRVDYGGGHGLIGATLQQVQESRADSWSFLLWQLGDPDFQPKAAKQ